MRMINPQLKNKQTNLKIDHADYESKIIRIK